MDEMLGVAVFMDVDGVDLNPGFLLELELVSAVLVDGEHEFLDAITGGQLNEKLAAGEGASLYELHGNVLLRELSVFSLLKEDVLVGEQRGLEGQGRDR